MLVFPMGLFSHFYILRLELSLASAWVTSISFLFCYMVYFWNIPLRLRLWMVLLLYFLVFTYSSVGIKSCPILYDYNNSYSIHVLVRPHKKNLSKLRQGRIWCPTRDESRHRGCFLTIERIGPIHELNNYYYNHII